MGIWSPIDKKAAIENTQIQTETQPIQRVRVQEDSLQQSGTTGEALECDGLL